jgi:hypothetical protein
MKLIYILKKDQSQIEVIFDICDLDYELSYFIENKPEKITKQNSQSSKIKK